VHAVRDGAWLLLDEINLAPHETLQALSSLLEGGSVCLTDAGSLTPVPRHANVIVCLIVCCCLCNRIVCV
jgi:midasin